MTRRQRRRAALIGYGLLLAFFAGTAVTAANTPAWTAALARLGASRSVSTAGLPAPPTPGPTLTAAPAPSPTPTMAVIATATLDPTATPAPVAIETVTRDGEGCVGWLLPVGGGLLGLGLIAGALRWVLVNWDDYARTQGGQDAVTY